MRYWLPETAEMQNTSPILDLILLAVVFSVISFLISFLSGWHELAGEYPLSGTFHGQRWRFRSANMRWGTRYGNCLTFGADQTGLFVSVVFPFRFGHPPLSIPWSEISVRPMRYFFISERAEFRFRRAPSIPFYVSPALAEDLRAAAGSAWPQGGPDPGAAIQDSLRA
ncbi:MAG: hypothetical protein GZ088_11630 [Acidipila sp.]|nr:hypothetical protein [Acidipila sp.]